MKNQLSHPCNLCHGQAFSVLSTRDRDGQYLRTVICQDCGLVWSDPFPINPSDYYRKEYRILYKGTYQPKFKHIYRAAKIAIERYQQLKPYLQSRHRIIEIGSGGGEFTYLLTKLGFEIQGIEPNEGYGQYSKTEYDLNIHIGCIQSVHLNRKYYDVAILSHVLEHLDNPTDVLQQLNHSLTDQGLLVIEVPNVEAICQSPNNTFHTAHLFNFNLQTLSLLVQKCGFEIITSHLSSDAGNIHLIAQKSAVDLSIDLTLSIDGNCEQIMTVIKQHRLVKHYLSYRPYLRLLKKIKRWVEEYPVKNRFENPKALLDHYYQFLDQ